jgi:hypothetical protein
MHYSSGLLVLFVSHFIVGILIEVYFVMTVAIQADPLSKYVKVF